MIRHAILLALLAATAAAQEAPETSPEPVQRPSDLGAGGEAEGERGRTPIAPPEATDAATVDVSAQAFELPMRELLDAGAEAYDACIAALESMGAKYVELSEIVPEDDPECGILRPLEVSSVLDGVALEPAATLRCQTARALGAWVRDFVMPAAERLGRGELTALVGGPGYTCRRRNNQPDGRLSQHAFGNAYDVLGFGFAEGDRLTIMPRARDGTIEESFQDAVRASACMEFTTVIGPGSDAYHDDHLHLDVVERRAGFRLCEQGADEGG
jgi:hypothetical protein